MNIAVITCAEPLHAGIALQTYALSEYLRGCGHSVQVIRYRPRYLRKVTPPIRRKTVFSRLRRRCSPRHFRCVRAFHRFEQLYLPLTSVYSTAKALHTAPPQAELYLTFGRVWNTWKRSGRDDSFYLTFAPSDLSRLAYAVSFAASVPPERERQRLIHRLHALDAVGIREQSGVLLAQKLGIHAECVCDPIFLLRPLQWKPLLTEVRARLPYVFIYDPDGNDTLRELALRLKEERGYQIVSGLPFSGAAVCCDRGPQDILSHIRSAALVLTSSCSILCCAMVFEREFIVFPRREHTNLRLYDLLSRLKLSDRLYSPTTMPWNQRTDYTTARPLLQQWIRSSEEFLQKNIIPHTDDDKIPET